MSHVHNLNGNSSAIAEYQEYLARLAADRRLLRHGQARKQFEVKSFDSAIESDPESDDDDGGQPEGEPNGEAKSPPAEDAEGHPGFSIKA